MVLFMEKILNIKNFHSSKKNADYTVLTILRDATQSEIKGGLIGTTCSEEIFMPDHLVNKFTEKNIGQEIERKYSVINGKAILDDVVLK